MAVKFRERHGIDQRVQRTKRMSKNMQNREDIPLEEKLQAALEREQGS